MARNTSDSFIELDRTFHELPEGSTEEISLEAQSLLHFGPSIGWDEILKGYRTIVLSEAGSGKTAEIRKTAEHVRNTGNQAFFLRLEHIAADFEAAFEVGSYEAFSTWLNSSGDAWFFLDSIDEARLRHPKDFEQAIRHLSRRILQALDRSHIIITGRASAWRALTDLQLCERSFPIAPEISKPGAAKPDSDDSGSNVDGSFETDDTPQADKASIFRVVALDDLSTPQIEKFARARGVADPLTLLAEIERTDAGIFTARPQDLEELIGFWSKEGRIGTRLELMKNSVERRLVEPNQDHRDAQPLALSKARAGVQLLAGASVLAKEPTFRVPDGQHNDKGVAVNAVLADWNDREQQTLLSRPIFDEAIYGTVRFHHRSVREYLAAEWLAELLRKSGSRQAVERLLFRYQYGIEVIVPSMRPILPWLSLMDTRICERTLRVSPQVLFEGGDPSSLLLDLRRRVLAEVCKELALGQGGRSAQEYAAVQRFASTDIAEDIYKQMQIYGQSAEIVSFLVRMVWLGRLSTLCAEVKQLALAPSTPRYVRISAIRALHAVGKDSDMAQLRASFASEGLSLDRGFMGEILKGSKPSVDIISWLLDCLSKAASEEKRGHDPLSDAVDSYTAESPLDQLPLLCKGFAHLINQAPYHEAGLFEMSKGNSWLLKPAAAMVERLVASHRAESLELYTLDILQKIKGARNWDHDIVDIKSDIGDIIPQWSELNRAVFWHDLRQTRTRKFFSSPANRLTNFWQVSNFGAFWRFGDGDFEYISGQINSADLQDDKLVLLSLALDIYSRANRPDSWLEQMRAIILGNPELEARIETFLNPPKNDYDREERKWKKKASTRKRKERESREESKQFIKSNIELVRAPQLESPTDISRSQWYLHEYLREDIGHSNRWTIGRWKELMPEFGEEAAFAYREGVTNFWRRFSPKLRSEPDYNASTPIQTIFGLAGLDIEAAENSAWPSQFSESDVLIASRYAIHELNGFPPWFARLFAAFPEIVGSLLFREIAHEALTELSTQESHYLLSDICWSGKWAWEYLSRPIFEFLRDHDVSNTFNLSKLLTVIQGSASITDKEIGELAKSKTAAPASPDIAAIWYANWTSVAPEEAIPAVSTHLVSLTDAIAQIDFAMTFVTMILSTRRSGMPVFRQRHIAPRFLKDLYLLMQRYIREDEDIDRSGGGVYSPGLRDNAQDARNAIYDQLLRIPGKEAYVALVEIAKEHPHAKSKPWLAAYAHNKAEEDADLEQWSTSQVRDFHEHLENTPSDNRELADLVVSRLLDLKEDLENGDDSVAMVLMGTQDETIMRNYLAHELRSKANGRYSITQEEEFADSKRPDLRFHGAGFDAPVPAELKLAERWTGPKLFERLENQLSGDYLRDSRSTRGTYLLVNRDKTKRWQLPTGSFVDFDGLLNALREYWTSIAIRHPNVEEISIIGIDLTKRFD